MSRERGAGTYILAEVASITHIHCLNVNADGYGLMATHRSHVLGNIYIMWSVLAAVVSLVVRESAVCLVALRDGRCDNDDVTFDSIFSFLHIGILCWIYICGSVLAAVVSLVVLEGAVHSVAFCDGRCDIDDATFQSLPLMYIRGCVAVIGESEVAACRCRSREHGWFVALCDEIL